MGPSKVGKTTLLASIDQAAHTRSPWSEAPKLTVVPGASDADPQKRRYSLADAVKRAVQTILTPSAYMSATDQACTYEFTMTATVGQRTYGADVVTHDGPGGALFPPIDGEPNAQLADWEMELIEGAKTADAIGLCLDPTDMDHLAACHLYLPSLLGRISSSFEPQPRLPSTIFERILERFGIERPIDFTETARRHMRARRFILLFTKADLMVEQHLQSKVGVGWVDVDERPVRLVEMIDATRQACELLGEGVLHRILDALPPDGQLGVAFTSAWGFDPLTGYPFMEPRGNEPLLTEGTDRHERLRDWTPYGVREAMVFMLTGEAHAPVSLVTAEALDQQLRTRAIAVRKNWPWFKAATQ
jgi:hypothetical protein